MAHTVRLETTDVEMPEYLRFMSRRGITYIKIADPAPIAGSGEIIEYRAARRADLVTLIREWFECGDEEAMQEMIDRIKAVK